MDGQHFTTGAPVYDTAGAKVGTLRRYNRQDGYLAVRQGRFFPKDRYIPLTAVGRGDAAGITLQLSKGEVRAARYRNPPAADGHVGRGDPPPVHIQDHA